MNYYEFLIIIIQKTKSLTANSIFPNILSINNDAVINADVT